MTLPLDGITVVSIEHAIAAPLATRHLADQGARVIKIERPDTGDFARGYDTRARGLSSHFVWTNRSKESLSLDLKSPDSPEILSRLLARADVFVQNLAPGAAGRLGLDFDTLHDAHPQLIVCNISGYGESGPDAQRKAYDLLIQAEAGFLSITGTHDTPAKAGISVADIASGMYAYSGILTALIQRGRTGHGSKLDISMLEALAEWIGYPMYYAMDDAPPPDRAGASHATIFPYGPFRVGDGSDVIFGLQNPREWDAFCTQVLQQPNLIEDPRFATNAARAQNRAALTECIETAFQAKNAADVRRLLDQAGIGNARMNDMAGLWSHEQLAARDRWTEVTSPSGPLPALRPPGTIANISPRMDPIPAPGEHTERILREIGYLDGAS